MTENHAPEPQRMENHPLKACPFCGEHAAAFYAEPLTWNSTAPLYGGRVRCDNCGAEGVTCYSDEGAADQLLAINEKMAADHWNERHNERRSSIWAGDE